MRTFGTLRIRLGAVVIALVLLLGSVTPSLAAGTYVVQPGDTLFSIALRFNVGISDLATLNHVYDVNTIYVGELLQLPTPLPAGYYATNPIYAIPTTPGYTVPAPYTAYGNYVVLPGDYLALIAARFNTTVAAIIAVNPTLQANPSLLFAGQIILVPNSVSVTVTTPPVQFHGNFYVVQPGDNLFSIAAKFGQDPYTIARANGLLDLNTVYAGTSLLIP